MKKDLKELCDLLHEEAEKKYPEHQRRINLLKMKKHQNESSTDFLRRVRRNLEVAEIETMTTEELGMHIFIESTDQILGKLAIDELQKKTPSLDDLENAVQATEVSAWYETQTRKGYSKIASAKQGKQCSKCNCSGHSQEECWGVCKWCKKSNHTSDRCYSKPKEEEIVEKANKSKKKINKKKKKGAKKAAMPALVDEEESDDDDSERNLLQLNHK